MEYQFDFGTLFQYLGLFAKGTAVTLGLTAVSALLGVGIGIGGAATLWLWGGQRWVKWSITAYVELIRNTPFIIQMFFIFFGLPGLGLRLSALQAAALAMTINLGAYTIEIVRAGFAAVPPGQGEAGQSIGLRPALIFALIVLPQALVGIYPAIVSQITITMLESAVVSQIAVVDLTHVGDFIQSRNFRAFETYVVVTIIYLVLALLMRRVLALAGRRIFAGRD